MLTAKAFLLRIMSLGKVRKEKNSFLSFRTRLPPPRLTDFHEIRFFWVIFRKSAEKKIKFRQNLTRITGTLHEDVCTEFLGGSQIFCISLILSDLRGLLDPKYCGPVCGTCLHRLGRRVRETLGDTQLMSRAWTALIGCLHAVCIDFHTSSSVRPSSPPQNPVLPIAVAALPRNLDFSELCRFNAYASQ